MLAWDFIKDEALPFGHNKSIAKGERAADCHLRIILFDLVWLNGEALVHLPLHQRNAKLKQLVKASTQVQIVTQQVLHCQASCHTSHTPLPARSCTSSHSLPP